MKKLIFFILISVFSSTFCFSKEKGISNPPRACNSPKTNFAFSHPIDNATLCPKDVYIYADFLWLSVFEEGLEYAGLLIDGGSSNSKKVNYNPGFRFAIGDSSLFKTTGMEAIWTYTRIKTNSSVQSDSESIFSLFLPPTSIAFLRASARLKGNLNSLDLNFFKAYRVSKYFNSSPKVGLRAAWIDQDYLLTYNSSEFQDIVTLKNDYWAIGLIGSYEAEYIIRKWIDFYGKGSFSLLFGKFKISQNSVMASVLFDYQIADDFYSVQPNAELQFGLNFHKNFNNDKLRTSLKLGYEFHQWWDQNQIKRIMDNDPVAVTTTTRGNLTFHGLRVSLSVDF